jgi:hypothetical protein
LTVRCRQRKKIEDCRKIGTSVVGRLLREFSVTLAFAGKAEVVATTQ